MSSTARKVLSITLEPICKSMAGPAIRCVELSKQLAERGVDVTIFTPRPSDLQAADLSASANLHLFSGESKATVYKLARSCDILFIQANVLKAYPLLARLDKHIIVDLYDPFLLAVLAQYGEDDASLNASYNLMHQVLERHMSLADFSICASERQRDYWLGRYCALGRMTPDLYRLDRSFRKLIDVVPFGLPALPPQRTGCGVKGKVDGIGQNDFLLLWGGGIWEWFDPLTIISAVAELSPRYPQLKLYFMGWKSPNPQVPLMEMAVRARKLAGEAGVLNKQVFFSDSWTSYDERCNVLLDADAAVSAHFDLPETRFSFRTRVLDYLWAQLPILTTGGDQLAEAITAGGAGQQLGFQDVDGWKQAISRLVEDRQLVQKYRQGSAALARKFHWDEVVAPLADYCLTPHKLPKYRRVRMPSLVERAQAVYSRGGKDLVLRRSRELLEDMLRR